MRKLWGALSVICNYGLIEKMETKEENLHSSKKDACCNYFMRSFGFVLALFLLWLAISYNMESDMLTELESSPIEGGFGDVYEPPNVHLKTVFEGNMNSLTFI